jgi:hypothetical protein
MGAGTYLDLTETDGKISAWWQTSSSSSYCTPPPPPPPSPPDKSGLLFLLLQCLQWLFKKGHMGLYMI